MKTGRALALGMKRLRTKLGMTQAALAERADVHEQFISQLERQERSPRLETIDALASAFGVKPWDLLHAGADTRAVPKAKNILSTRVRAVVEAWPEGDRDRLLEVLTSLGKVVSKAKRPARKK